MDIKLIVAEFKDLNTILQMQKKRLRSYTKNIKMQKQALPQKITKIYYFASTNPKRHTIS